MVKKAYCFLVFLFFSFLVLRFFTSAVYAQNDTVSSFPEDLNTELAMPDRMIAPPYPEGITSPFFGQNHFYSYTFRGNGEAVVTAKIILTNASESDALKETSLRFPDISPSNILVYQILGRGVCIRYDTPGFEAASGGYRPPTCLEYGEPDYFGYWGEAKYQKAEFDFSGDTLVIKLPSEIKPQKSGAFFVHFRTSDLTKKQPFSGFKYEIETLMVDSEINQLTVGINTDANLFLKGARGEVDYRGSELALQEKAVPSGADAQASVSIDRFLSTVGYGLVTRSASNLAPLESFRVEGEYAKSRFGLYASELGVSLVVFLALGIVFLLIFKKVSKSLKGEKKEAKSGQKGYFGISLGISFVSSALIGLYSAVAVFLARLLSELIYFEYQSFIILFLMLISLCVYVFLLFAPGVFWGVKKEMGWGVGVVIMTIAWLFVFFATALGIIFFVGNTGGGFSPIPLPAYFE